MSEQTTPGNGLSGKFVSHNASTALSGLLAIALIAAVASRDETAKQDEAVTPDEITEQAVFEDTADEMQEAEASPHTQASDLAMSEVALPAPPPLAAPPSVEPTPTPLMIEQETVEVEPENHVTTPVSAEVEPGIVEVEPEPVRRDPIEDAQALEPSSAEKPEFEASSKIEEDEPEISDAPDAAPVTATPEQPKAEQRPVVETARAPSLDEVLAELDRIAPQPEIQESIGQNQDDDVLADTEVEVLETPEQFAAALPKVETVVRAGEASERSGRALLHLLESGVGPSIEIAWPSDRSMREKLTGILSNCHGMVPAMLLSDGRSYTLDGPPGRAEVINLDRLSGFVRQPAGQLTAIDHRNLKQLQGRHGPVGGAYVRLFDRAVDAALLGGLQQLVGDRYRQASSITAHYTLSGNDVSIERIRQDGRSVAGKIILPQSSGCRS